MPHHDKHEAHLRLVARLRQQADDVRRLTAGLDDAALARRAKPQEWSLKELVCHLHRLQDVFEGRIDRMLTEDNPATVSYSPEGDAEFDRMAARPGADCLSGFLHERARFAKRLEELTPAQWHRAGRHPDFAQYDVHFQVEYMLHHEAHHVYQILQRRVPLGKLPH
ncbi:MAG: DinB family protein [Candidatus Solibacter usitatus]|nr:DinB family protein [Candidatus Solibacter usitatus]